MINQNELRIGGQFIDPKDGVTYKATSITLFTVTGASKKGEQYAFSYDQIDPIPLTEDMLLKAGFINASEGFWNKDGLLLGYITTDEYFEYEYSPLPIGVAAIRYVHQLQNLRFALTGEEEKLLKLLQ